MVYCMTKPNKSSGQRIWIQKYIKNKNKKEVKFLNKHRYLG